MRNDPEWSDLNKNHDPYASWTDEERMTEYAHTGDPIYLTPVIARRMQVSSDVMRNVIGADQNDISDAEEWYEDIKKADDQHLNMLLKQYGIDQESLEELNLHQKLRALLEVASFRVATAWSQQDAQNEIAREESLRKLHELIINYEGSVQILIESLRYDSSKGIKEIGVVEKIIDRLKAAYENGDQSATPPLVEFLRTADEILELEFNPQANYLVLEKLAQLLRRESGIEPMRPDIDTYVPFEITKGTYAAFSSDLDRIYVANKEMSEHIKEIIRESWTPEYQGEDGHDIPSYKYEYISEDLVDSIDGVLDAGTPLDRIAVKIGITDPDIVEDYIAILSSSTREIIETKFNFHLIDLTIKEQLYFLSYLKNIKVERAELVQSFAATYGVDGMRTFLSLERGTEDLGDKIVTFGQYKEVAQKVFSYYCELLDIAERAEDLVKEITTCEGQVCIDLATQVQENILNRAQKDLEDAVRATDPGAIEAKIQNYVAEAKEYVAILQELGTQETEQVAAQALSEQDKQRMRELLDNNYALAYSGEEDAAFREAIKASLEKSFSNQNTEFHLLRDKDIIISYNRFDVSENPNGQRVNYFGSFNADPVYSGVGSVMLERTIEAQLQNCDVMYAHCDPTSDIAKKYIESGFVAKETETVAGKFSFEIWRTKDISEHIRSKQMTPEQLTEMIGETTDSRIVVREVIAGDKFEELDEGLGYLLTRYFKHDGKAYAAFEIPSPTLWNQLQV